MVNCSYATNAITWLQNSREATSLKQGFVSVVAAGTMTVILGVTLLILAKNGCNLQGINAIATQCCSSTLYYVLGGSCIILSFDSVLIGALLYQHKHRMYSERELIPVHRVVMNQNIAAKMHDSIGPGYWKLNPEDLLGELPASPAIYALRVKHATDNYQLFGFKYEQDREDYLQTLINYEDLRTTFERDLYYPKAYVQSVCPQFNSVIRELESEVTLKVGEFRYRVLEHTVTEEKTYLVFLRQNEKQPATPYLCKKIGTADNLKRNYRDFDRCKLAEDS